MGGWRSYGTLQRTPSAMHSSGSSSLFIIETASQDIKNRAREIAALLRRPKGEISATI
jgi:hypothetical protein